MTPSTSDALMLVFDYLLVSTAESAAERLVLHSLAARVNRSRGDWQVWPTMARVAGESGISKMTVRRALRSLVERGILTVVREGVGRGNPTVYRLEKVTLCTLLADGKRDQPGPGKGTKREAPVQDQPEVLRTGSTGTSAEADAVALADLWNRTVTSPIPKVRLPLSPDRVRVYAKAWGALTLEEWSLVMAHVNGQDWCRAPGVGDHPSWTATLDWLVKKPATWQRHLEKAQTAIAATGPRSRAEAYRQTNERNAASVGAMPFTVMGGQVGGTDDEED